ncbi:MAG: hypothetical protein IIC58_05685 [Proteobacteria bacterium]|nr:hypothetical protein [Pseudomonadota bacterium]
MARKDKSEVMGEQNKISTLLDEFSGDEQSYAALDDLLSDVNLQYTLRRYQMIGEVMRHELPDQLNIQFSASVKLHIDQIETHTRSTDIPSNLKGSSSLWAWPFLKPVAGLAIAATVALVSVTLWQSVNSGSPSSQVVDQLANVDRQQIEQLTNQTVPSEAVTVSTKINEGMRWTIINDTPALQQKLNAYLVNHTEYSNSMQGLIPQVRVVGFDSQQ